MLNLIYYDLLHHKLFDTHSSTLLNHLQQSGQHLNHNIISVLDSLTLEPLPGFKINLYKLIKSPKYFIQPLVVHY